MHQQRKECESWGPIPTTKLFDLLRRRQRGDCGCNLRIVNSKQGAGARRFQDHLVASAPQIRETRQHENIGIADFRQLWPVIGNLRLDDDLIRVARRGAKAVFQQTAPGQSSDQEMNFLVNDPSVALERSERQARAQSLYALGGVRFELSQPDGMTIDANGIFSARPHFKRGVTDEAGG